MFRFVSGFEKPGVLVSCQRNPRPLEHKLRFESTNPSGFFGFWFFWVEIVLIVCLWKGTSEAGLRRSCSSTSCGISTSTGLGPSSRRQGMCQPCHCGSKYALTWLLHLISAIATHICFCGEDLVVSPGFPSCFIHQVLQQHERAARPR